MSDWVMMRPSTCTYYIELGHTNPKLCPKLTCILGLASESLWRSKDNVDHVWQSRQLREEFDREGNTVPSIRILQTSLTLYLHIDVSSSNNHLLHWRQSCEMLRYIAGVHVVLGAVQKRLVVSSFCLSILYPASLANPHSTESHMEPLLLTILTRLHLHFVQLRMELFEPSLIPFCIQLFLRIRAGIRAGLKAGIVVDGVHQILD